MSAVSSAVLPSVPSLKTGAKNKTTETKGKTTTPKVVAAKSAQPSKIVKTTTKGKAVAAAKSAKSETPTPRKGFTLTDEDLEHFRNAYKANKGKFTADLIPHNRGNYRSLIEALLTLRSVDLQDDNHEAEEGVGGGISE